MKTMTGALAIILSAVSISATANGLINNTIANYLGTGNNPELALTLSANEAKWKSFTIDYQHTGGMPTGWSTWNVTDTEKKPLWLHHTDQPGLICKAK